MKKTIVRALLIIPIIFINACNGDMDDLTNYIAVKKKAVIDSVKKKPAAELPRLPSVSYKAASRIPFEVAASVSDTKKPIEPLNVYSLSTLRFIGTITDNNVRWAIILTPDRLTYKVKVGDTIGDHYGKITAIDLDKMEIIESFTENEKKVTQRMVTLQLKDEH